MKICLAVRSFAPNGGTGRYATTLAQHLASRQHQVFVLCMESAPSEDLQNGGVYVEELPVPRLGSLISMLAFAWLAHRRSHQSRFDATIALARIPGFDIYRAGGGCHEEYLQTVPGWRYHPRHHVERSLDVYAARSALRVVANAPAPRDQLIRRYRLDPAKVRMIPNGVDATRFCPSLEAKEALRDELSIPKDCRVIAFIGAGFRRKGLDLAIRAVSGLKGVVLLVVGGDRGVGPYIRAARNYGVDMRLLGARPDPERILQASDVLLLPTRYDSAANAVLEAMACALPVVTSGANGASAFLPEPWMVVADVEDVDGYRASLERALQRPEAGQRCREIALRMSWEAHTDAMEALLEEVVRTRSQLVSCEWRSPS